MVWGEDYWGISPIWAIARGQHCISNYSNDAGWGVASEFFNPKNVVFYFPRNGILTKGSKFLEICRERRILEKKALLSASFIVKTKQNTIEKKDCAFNFKLNLFTFGLIWIQLHKYLFLFEDSTSTTRKVFRFIWNFFQWFDSWIQWQNFLVGHLTMVSLPSLADIYDNPQMEYLENGFVTKNYPQFPPLNLFITCQSILQWLSFWMSSWHSQITCLRQKLYGCNNCSNHVFLAVYPSS